MRITDTTFKGISPKTAPQALQPGQAQAAANCKVDSGELRPWDNEQYKETLDSRMTVQTIFKYLSEYMLEFNADVDIAEGPVAADTTQKLYYTGDGIPKKTNSTEAVDGGAPYPSNYFPMAVPTPAVAPTAVLGAGGSGDARNIFYIWTIVTSWGEESIPSDPSDVVEAKNGQTVNLSAMTIVWQAAKAYVAGNWVVPATLGDYVYKCVTAGTSGAIAPTWNSTVDGDIEDGTVEWRCYKKGILFDTGGAKRIYRTNTGENSASWQMVADIAMTATTYEDSTADADLEAVYCPSETWDPPPDDLTGLVALSGGFFAAFKGKDIYFSEPYYLHAWPQDYILSLPFTIVGLAVVGNTLIATTTKNPYMCTGSHPGQMTPTKLPDPKGNVSKRGIVVSPFGAMYPSNSGLELVNAEGHRSITRDLFSKSDWAGYYPETFNAVFYDGKYVGFYSSGGNVGALVLDFESGDVTTLNFYASAAWVDPADETLYFVKQQAEVRLLENGTAYPSRTNARLKEDGGYRLLES